MTTRVPAEVFPPGEFIKEEIDARGWTAKDLADITGRSAAAISEILAAKRRITPETAKAFAAAFGTTPELWMGLESSYQLSQVRGDKFDIITRRARLYEMAPVKEMIKRGWVEPTDDIDILEVQILSFLGRKSLDDDADELDVAARKSSGYDVPSSPAQNAWLRRSMQICRAAPAAQFDPKNLNALLTKLKLYMEVPQEIRHVPRVMAEAGIRFAVVEPLKGSKIDGACFWDDDVPSIVLSTRFDRIDNFWFVLLHELGHVVERDSSNDEDLMGSLRDGGRPEKELRADQFAEQHLVPPAKLEGFIKRTRPLYSIRKIQAFARTMHVHPGIVIGQLQYRRELPWSSFRNALEPVREFLLGSALTDGWGASLPPSATFPRSVRGQG